MNKTKLMNHIKRELGIRSWRLPISDDDIMDIINEEATYIFSQHYPKVIDLVLDLSDYEYYDPTEQIYTIPLDLMIPKNCELINVKRLKYPNLYGGNINIHMMMNNNLDDYMVSSAGGLLDGAIEKPSTTFQFIPPNKIKFFNLYTLFYNQITIEVGLRHSNLDYIPESCATFFRDFSTQVTKKFLYKELKHYANIETTFGTINLNIDDWQDADNKVEEMTTTLMDERILYPQNDKRFTTA